MSCKIRFLACLIFESIGVPNNGRLLAPSG
jgi:hypothetical protein